MTFITKNAIKVYFNTCQLPNTPNKCLTFLPSLWFKKDGSFSKQKVKADGV